MRRAPRNRIAKDAIKAWKMTAGLCMAIVWLLICFCLIITYKFPIPNWVSAILILAGVLGTYLFVFRIPKMRYRRWRYEVFDQEIYIQHGLLIITQTIVPMVRVQHVDTKQGPILKKYHLSDVTITTAATTHVIPALLVDDAVNLRDRISQLAKVDEQDV